MIKIANAPCSWGVLEFDLVGKAAGFEQVLNEISETGYEGSELGDWGFMPSEPAALKAELDQRKLSMIGAFVPVFLKDRSKHLAGGEVAVKTAKLMADADYTEAFIVLADDNGSIPERTLNAGRVTPEMGLTPEEWLIFAEGANYVAAEVKAKTGLRTVFHHHCAGYVETPAEVDQLMALTDPTLVGLVLDMGHYQFGGGDPLDALIKHQSRIWHIHFKDCHPEIAANSRTEGWDYFKSVGSGVFCELGKGAVDFPAIVKELHSQNYEGWITVEQDVLPGMGNPKVCAQRNREYIKSLGL
ncbi:MAG: sugar phosphate isomerase/epimerase [Mariniphaga sp.]